MKDFDFLICWLIFSVLWWYICDVVWNLKTTTLYCITYVYLNEKAHIFLMSLESLIVPLLNICTLIIESFVL